MALYIDRYCDPAANVTDLGTILVRLYMAGTLLRAFAYANRTAGGGFTRLTYNVASRNLKVAVVS